MLVCLLTSFHVARKTIYFTLRIAFNSFSYLRTIAVSLLIGEEKQNAMRHWTLILRPFKNACDSMCMNRNNIGANHGTTIF